MWRKFRPSCFFASPSPRGRRFRGSPSETDGHLMRRVSRLVGQLNDDRAVQRDAAEVELAGREAAQSDQFLTLLPEGNDDLPLAVRERSADSSAGRRAGGRKAFTGTTVAPWRPTNMPLAEALAAIEKQTGNKLIDNRRAMMGGQG